MEDIRFKIQRFFSNKKVIITIVVIAFAALMVILNFSGTLAIDYYNYLRLSMKTKAVKHGFTMPNPFVFSWVKLKWFYLISGILSLMFSVRLGFLMKFNLTPLSDGKQKGSRRFASIPELESQYRMIPEKSDKYDGKGGFPISRYKDKIFIDDSPVNNLIIGTTRSGKGETYVIPTIDIYSRAKKICDRASMIIADPKGELVSASKSTLEERGYNVLVFDLLTFSGLSYNPLQLVLQAYLKGNAAEAQLLANTLSFVLFHDPNAKDKTWENWSIALTNALILAITIDCCSAAKNCTDKEEKKGWYSKVNMYSVSRLLIDLGEPKDDDGPNELDKFFSSRDLNDIARIQYASVAYATGKTKGNIFSNTLAQLIKFTMEPIAKMTSVNTVDLKSIGFGKERPTAVFLVIPDYDTSNQFLVTVFISQLYYVLSKESSSVGGKCPREVVFLLDEFGNITPIPDMAHILTVCLGRNIRFDLIVQAYSQIFHQYGEQDGKTILGACGNQIYLLTIEEDTARKMSVLIGNKTITAFSRTEDNSLSLDKKIGEHIDTQPLLNPNELMEFEPGESVVVRITKRTDLQGNKIRPDPIFNHGETAMKYRYEYLADDFDTQVSFRSLQLEKNCKHKDIRLSSVIYSPPPHEKSQYAFQEMLAVNSDPPVSNLLQEQQAIRIKQFFESESFDVDSIDQSMTLTEFEAFLQGTLDAGAITQQTYDDIYTILCSIGKEVYY